MEEKRRHQRYLSGPRNFVAKYAQDDRICGHINDFSRSGMSFHSNDLFDSNREINLNLEISGLSHIIPTTIKILWGKPQADKHTYGAELVNIDPESKYDILDLLYQDWKGSVASS